MKLFDSITGAGAIAALERRFAGYTGRRFAVAMSSGTTALHASLIAAGVKRGDEVIVPSFTWGGTVTGVLQLGAVPVFADIDETLTIDPAQASRHVGPRTKALIAVHLFGHPCDVVRLAELCNRDGVVLIEDCAQAFGASISGQVVGSFGVGCFSFGFGKPLSVGEGGMLITNDPSLYDRVLYHTQHPLRQLKDMQVGASPNQFALNYRLSPLAASAALRRFDPALRSIERSRTFYDSLHQDLVASPLAGLTPLMVRPGVKHSWHRFCPAIDTDAPQQTISAIRDFFEDQGCEVDRGHIKIPLHRDPVLRRLVSRRVARQIKEMVLPQTDRACATRVVVRRKEER